MDNNKTRNTDENNEKLSFVSGHLIKYRQISVLNAYFCIIHELRVAFTIVFIFMCLCVCIYAFVYVYMHVHVCAPRPEGTVRSLGAGVCKLSDVGPKIQTPVLTGYSALLITVPSHHLWFSHFIIFGKK